MRILFCFVAALFCSCAANRTERETDLAQYVNPLVGTALAGNTFPGAITPFGMIQLSPDTRFEWQSCPGYHYGDTVVYGFSHTHLSGTGCADYCDFLFMPFVGATSVINTEYRSPFSQASETAEAGYYSVVLDKHGIKAELTAAPRAGVQRYSFPKSDKEKGLLVDLKHRDKTLYGYLAYDPRDGILSGIRNSSMFADYQQLSFATAFSVAPTRIEVFIDDQLAASESATGNVQFAGTNLKALLYFPPEVEELTLKTAISSNIMAADSTEKCRAARHNLDEYSDFGFDFDRFRLAARKLWNDELSRIIVETRDTEKKRVFYTALYHTFTAPCLFTDRDGSYFGMDRRIHRADEGHEVYTVFSLWDTYRTLHPLLNIIDRKRSEDFIRTFMKHYEQGGSLPVWELSGYETSCMIGYHSAPTIYDAFAKGIAPYDHARMLEALVHSARTRWRGLPEFAACGYIPADAENESVSKALEYAYDDWCIAQFARATGNDAVWREFTDRSQYYKNILDPDGFMHARINGAFTEPFNPCELNATLTEANSWQYATSVPHDADTYIALLGGEKTAERFFDSLFGTPSERIKGLHPDVTGLIGQYAHGNEPSHHVAYWYNFTGSPDKTARIVRRIMNEFYSSRPDGICGNDDCGQMSAWYVASAIGFYPFCPGSNVYPLGSPIFDKITVRLENGKQFVVRCINQNDRNIFIRSARLNGRNHPKSFIEYNDMKDGGELVLQMSDTPGDDFGRAPENRPRTRVEPTITLTPRFSIPHKTFADSATLSMFLYQPARRDDKLDFAFPADTDAIYYTLDGSEPDTSSTLYTAPIPVESNMTVKAAAYSKTTGYSKTVSAGYTRYARDKDIISQTPCTPAYDGGGDNALVDGRRGGKIFNLGEWRGYDGKDMEAVIDLRATKNIAEAGAGFIQDLGVWIVFPAEVTFEISDDNVSYRHYGTVKSSVPPESRHAQTLDYVVRKPARARYLRVRAKHYGKMPSWHVGAGLNSHLFIDEIFIR